MLVCLRLSELVMFVNLFKGSEGSIRLVRLYLGDSIHHHFQSVLISSLVICLTADMLIGSRFCRNAGSRVFKLEPLKNHLHYCV